MAFRPNVFLDHNTEDREIYYGRALPHLEELAEVRINPHDRNMTTPEIIEIAADCDIIISHRATPGETALFDQSPRLLAFLRTALDVSTVDIEAASRNGVLVANAGTTFIDATAELALGLMLDVARDITASTVDYHAGSIPPSNMGLQLSGSTAGIIGYGDVGSRLCEILVALGMKVLVSDPYKKVERDGMQQVDLQTLLAESDFVLPLAIANAETENMIGADEFALMKSSAVFVNVSRGNLVDEKALEAAFTQGRFAKLALDVGRAEDQRPSPHIASLPGVVATPHLGGLTGENAFAQTMSSVEQLAAIINGQIPERALNAEQATRLRKFWEEMK
ncbi:MAG: hydroxyacid dehydrogenase [Rhodospirillales bacterium]|nr:hydroxyacid dehydrogenase [Rhodospirillales bacterium]